MTGRRDGPQTEIRCSYMEVNKTREGKMAAASGLVEGQHISTNLGNCMNTAEKILAMRDEVIMDRGILLAAKYLFNMGFVTNAEALRDFQIDRSNQRDESADWKAVMRGEEARREYQDHPDGKPF